tara:strand:- start:13 stop:237 length:225 start_codon:yes stop_codon:yes gene_type:complete
MEKSPAELIEGLEKTLCCFPQIQQVEMTIDNEGTLIYIGDISGIPDAPTPEEFKLKFQDLAGNVIDVEFPQKPV